MMYHKQFVSFLAIAGLMAGVAFAAPAFAQTGARNGFFRGGEGKGNGAPMMQPGVRGTVSAVNGSTLTVTDDRTNTAYTVDASNATVQKNGSASSLSAVGVGDTVMIRGAVSGTSVTAKSIWDGAGVGRGPGIFGTIASVSGTTFTVTSKAGPNGAPAAATYTVDASNAKVTKGGNQSASVSDLAVGDSVMVQGTVNGLNVVAATVRDNPERPDGKPNPIIEGDGSPVLGGNVTAVNGTALTVTNKSNVAYAVDASNAKIEKAGASASLSAVAVGDSVLVQGTVNGTSIVASSVIDQGTPAGASAGNAPKAHGGLWEGIVGFFQHLFGF
jgi:riboflavin synthase alpha subunit